MFVFHRQHYTRYKPLVQPPRLGGKTTMGVYVDGGDFLDGTPALDIKPYVPFIDAIPEARSDWATPSQDGLEVAWNTEALRRLNKIEPDSDLVTSGSPGLKSLIEQTLAQDPRPAHERGKDGKQGQHWGVMIGPAHVRFKVEGGVAIIEVVEPH